MPSLKDLRNRITSVKATRKITKAMQMVAAAKLRRAQETVTAARPYADRMDQMIASVGARITDKGATPLLSGTGRDQVHLMVVMTGERGLAGGFNTNISKLARLDAQRLLAQGKTVKMLMVGRKGAEALKREFGSLLPRPHRPARRAPDRLRQCRRDRPEASQALRGRRVRHRHALLLGVQDRVITQKPTALQLIPAKLPAAKPQGTGNAEAIHEYEPSEEEVLGDLVTLNISTQIFRGLLENVASFYGAQMSAMDSATRNAGEMIDKLTLRYNRTRQAMITKELIEIISGADAL